MIWQSGDEIAKNGPLFEEVKTTPSAGIHPDLTFRLFSSVLPIIDFKPPNRYIVGIEIVGRQGKQTT
jgi:hypothetical protein